MERVIGLTRMGLYHDEQRHYSQLALPCVYDAYSYHCRTGGVHRSRPDKHLLYGVSAGDWTDIPLTSISTHHYRRPDAANDSQREAGRGFSTGGELKSRQARASRAGGAGSLSQRGITAGWPVIRKSSIGVVVRVSMGSIMTRTPENKIY